MVRNGKRSPDRVPEVDVASFLVIYYVTQFAQGFYNILAGKDGEMGGHMSTSTNASFEPGRL